MKKYFGYLLTVVFLSVLVASCGNKDKTGLLVPKDAAMVVHISLSSFSSKLSWKDIQATEWFKRMYVDRNTPDSLAKQLMDDPEKSGMDLKSDLVFFLQKSGAGGYIVFEGKVKDAAAFEAFAKKIKPEGKIEKKDGLTYFGSMDDQSILAWNDKRYILAHHESNMHLGGRFSKGSGDEDVTENTTPKKYPEDSIKLYAKSILDLSGSKLLGTDSRFASLLNEAGEIHLWMNTSVLSSENPFMMDYGEAMNIKAITEDNYSATTLNFDMGKIVVKSKQYYGEEITKLIKKFDAKPVQASLINRVPGDVAAVIAVSFPPESIKELFKVLGLDGIANAILSRANFNIDDFVKGNKGEMVFAVSDVGLKKWTMSPDDSAALRKFEGNIDKDKMIPSANFLFANAVNDKQAFQRLLDIALKNGNTLEEKIPGFTYKVEGDWFLAGNSADNMAKFSAGGDNHHPFADRISGHPLAVYIDIQKILIAAAKAPMPGSGGEVVMGTSPGLKASLNMWQDVVATGGNFKDGAVETNIEVNLVNKNENSLKQLNAYFDQMLSGFMPRSYLQQEMMDSIPADSSKRAF